MLCTLRTGLSETHQTCSPGTNAVRCVLTGLWKRCARMVRRIVTDTVSDTVCDTWAVGLVRQELPHDCTISSTAGCGTSRGTLCGTSCGSSGVLFPWFLSDILACTPGFHRCFGRVQMLVREWLCKRSGMIPRDIARIRVVSAAGGRVPLRADSPRALSCTL